MARINDEKLEKAIDYIEELSDAKYEKLLDTFEKEQPELYSFLNEKLEDLDDEDQRNDVITIMMIIYYVISTENPNMFIVSNKIIDKCETRQQEILEEINQIARTSELLDDEDLSLAFIPNKYLHNFVTATLDPGEEDSPFDEASSDKAYHIVKVCVDCLAEVI
ncbi:MAG: hypothetical protein RH860_05140 [Cytophagales bacterium]